MTPTNLQKRQKWQLNTKEVPPNGNMQYVGYDSQTLTVTPFTGLNFFCPNWISSLICLNLWIVFWMFCVQVIHMKWQNVTISIKFKTWQRNVYLLSGAYWIGTVYRTNWIFMNTTPLVKVLLRMILWINPFISRLINDAQYVSVIWHNGLQGCCFFSAIYLCIWSCASSVRHMELIQFF